MPNTAMLAIALVAATATATATGAPAQRGRGIHFGLGAGPSRPTGAFRDRDALTRGQRTSFVPIVIGVGW
ncbi:MAG TPA: hypothetical protein VKA84_22300 [Gemmatimonadaceae bacterium]|nr:hypothetical protein [Gemmatimonadaceae bacterium]